MKMEKPYHHGDLRSALLAAAEAELAANGIEAFSLRAVAKRAGVSHAAPAHHFGDVSGLLTALAAVGHARLQACQSRREAAAGDDPVARFQASGIGYVDFAMDSPALFRLIFGSNRLNWLDPALVTAATASYNHLVQHVTALGGQQVDATAAWALAHGLADLAISGRLASVTGLPPPAREALLAGLFRRVLP